MPCKAWGSISVHESSKPVLAQIHAASWQKAFVSHPAMWDSHNCQLTGSTSVSPLKWIQLKIMRWTQSHRKWAVKELRKGEEPTENAQEKRMRSRTHVL